MVSYVVNYITDIDTPHLCSTAVMEEKKWLKEKRLTNSKLELDHGTCTSNSLMPLLVSNSFIWSLALIVHVCAHTTHIFIWCWILVPWLGIWDCKFLFFAWYEVSSCHLEDFYWQRLLLQIQELLPFNKAIFFILQLALGSLYSTMVVVF